MFRNVESHFSHVPQANIPRSVLGRPSTHTTSFNFGDLVPLYVDSDILPGDSVKMETSKIVRLQTMLAPILGDMYFDIYWFFVPHRLVWKHWKEFMGENTQSAWIQQTQYTIPSISAPSGGFQINTVADYMGFPTGIDWSASDVNAPNVLALRAYAMVADQFFRDQNLTDPLNIPDGDANQTGTNGSNYINDVANGGKCFKVAKFHDYFTSCLPNAQKGQAVTFPLISGGLAPVITTNDSVPGLRPALRWKASDNGGVQPPISTGDHVIFAHRLTSDTTGEAFANYAGNSYTPGSGGSGVVPANLWANLDTTVGAVTVNELRLAFQLQKFYEREARSGSRYTEVIRSFFGVISPDARLQRPEYLGGNRIAINIHEVTNSAQTATDFLGDLGAKSVTSDVHYDFDHSFTEHGTLLCVGCARYTHQYAQGLEKQFMRKDKFDFFFPVFDSLGEQPVYDANIYADSTTMANKSVFGYQEAWAEYRYKSSRVSSEMRPQYNLTLASWNLADKYTQKPTLSDGWIREDPSTLNRVLSVNMSNGNQVFGDFYFNATYTRPMSVYSVPGLIDHF